MRSTGRTRRASSPTPATSDTLDAASSAWTRPWCAPLPALRDYAGRSFCRRPAAGRRPSRELVARIHEDFTYDPTATDITTPVLEVLQAAPRRVSGLRAPGHRLPAQPGPGRPLRERLPGNPAATGQAKLQGADASHAWLQVYLPGTGWQDWDPTNNLQPSGRHITTAWGRDYSDVTPLQGVIYGGGDTPPNQVEVDVTALPEPVEF